MGDDGVLFVSRSRSGAGLHFCQSLEGGGLILELECPFEDQGRTYFVVALPVGGDANEVRRVRMNESTKSNQFLITDLLELLVGLVRMAFRPSGGEVSVLRKPLDGSASWQEVAKFPVEANENIRAAGDDVLQNWETVRQAFS